MMSIKSKIERIKETIEKYERNIKLQEPPENNPFKYMKETRDQYAKWNYIHCRRPRDNKTKLPLLREKLKKLELKLRRMDT